VLADIAIQAGEEFFEADDPAELVQLAMTQRWTVSYAVAGQPGVITLPGQEVTEDDLPMLTALFEELLETDPVPPYDVEALLDGAVRRMASVNAEDVGEEPVTS
jgi:hypothetical protein